MRPLGRSKSKKVQNLRRNKPKKVTKLPMNLTSNEFYMQHEIAKIDKKMNRQGKPGGKYPLIGLNFTKTGSKFFKNLGKTGAKIDTSKYRKDSFQSGRTSSRSNLRNYRRGNVIQLRQRRPLNSTLVFNSLAQMRSRLSEL